MNDIKNVAKNNNENEINELKVSMDKKKMKKKMIIKEI